MKFCKISAACSYMITGVLFGLAFPFCCLLFLTAAGEIDLSAGVLPAIRQAHESNVLFYVIDTAPIFLGLFARFAGVRQDRIDGFNKQLRHEVSEKTQSLWMALEDAKQAHEQVLHMAHHDPLTGLANRNLFRKRFEQALEKAEVANQVLALIFIDIDHFKSFNDEMGHDVGDALLCEISTRLLNNLNHGDTVARVGGDEFVMVLTNLNRTDSVPERLGRLSAAIEAPMFLAGRELAVTASLGVSLFPEHGDQADKLLCNADKAMYRVKRSGRGGYQLFDAKFEATADRETLIASELAHAIERKQLSVHYQPQILLSSGKEVAAEALLRWEHPDLGQVPPLDFIPIAEQSDLIVEIGTWVLNQACHQAYIWQKHKHPGFRIAVNVSAHQFHRGNFAEIVKTALAKSRLPANCLELELTERVFLAHSDEVISTLHQLAEMGVSIAVDDFGTAYSSLSYLKHFPMHKLKIDRVFVAELMGSATNAHDAAMTRAIIAMAKSLGLRVVAEGIETADQLAFLTSEGCDEAQGFFLGRPAPPEKIQVSEFELREGSSVTVAD